jgi:hypothetical protein
MVDSGQASHFSIKSLLGIAIFVYDLASGLRSVAIPYPPRFPESSGSQVADVDDIDVERLSHCVCVEPLAGSTHVVASFLLNSNLVRRRWAGEPVRSNVETRSGPR